MSGIFNPCSVLLLSLYPVFWCPYVDLEPEPSHTLSLLSLPPCTYLNICLVQSEIEVTQPDPTHFNIFQHSFLNSSHTFITKLPSPQHSPRSCVTSLYPSICFPWYFSINCCQIICNSEQSFAPSPNHSPWPCVTFSHAPFSVSRYPSIHCPHVDLDLEHCSLCAHVQSWHNKSSAKTLSDLSNSVFFNAENINKGLSLQNYNFM